MKNKIKILIVDDTYEKTEVIASIIKDIPDCSIETCISSRDVISKLHTQHYDLMIVDLQIPCELGEPLDPCGGKELIQFCTLNENLNRPTHILGVTSHSELFESNRVFFLEGGWPLLLVMDDHEILKSIVQTKVKYSYPKPMQVDIAIVTALRKVEFEAVLSLPCEWEEVRYAGDSNKYFFGKISLASGEVKSIITTSCSRMGIASAAATTMKVCNRFSPGIVIMTGIAAGIKEKTRLGDILVADPCWDWGSGKLTMVDGKVSFLSSPHQMPLDAAYRSIFQEISVDRTFLDEIQCGWDSEDRPSSALNLHVGPLATGAVVLEDPDTLEKIMKQHREIIGVEMEAYGFAYAASIASNCPPKAIIIKSVCDFAEPNRDDSSQKYAAYTSAQLTYKFLINFC